MVALVVDTCVTSCLGPVSCLVDKKLMPDSVCVDWRVLWFLDDCMAGWESPDFAQKDKSEAIPSYRGRG